MNEKQSHTNEQNRVKDANRWEANQLAAYKRGRGVEPGNNNNSRGAEQHLNPRLPGESLKSSTLITRPRCLLNLPCFVKKHFRFFRICEITYILKDKTIPFTSYRIQLNSHLTSSHGGSITQLTEEAQPSHDRTVMNSIPLKPGLRGPTTHADDLSDFHFVIMERYLAAEFLESSTKSRTARKRLNPAGHFLKISRHKKTTISAKSVETLSLLRNLGQIPPPKSVFPSQPLPPKKCCFLIANSSFFRYQHWRGEAGEEERVQVETSYLRYCNVKVIFPSFFSSQFSVSNTFVAYRGLLLLVPPQTSTRLDEPIGHRWYTLGFR